MDVDPVIEDEPHMEEHKYGRGDDTPVAMDVADEFGSCGSEDLQDTPSHSEDVGVLRDELKKKKMRIQELIEQLEDHEHCSVNREKIR